eukprot:6481560-Prymnesium_polylepis.1
MQVRSRGRRGHCASMLVGLALRLAAAVPVETPDALANGGFELGPKHWDILCYNGRCGQTEIERHACRSGSGAMSFRMAYDSWSQVELKQLVSMPALEAGALLRFEVHARSDGAESPMAPALFELELQFDMDDGAGGTTRRACNRQWTELPPPT